MDLTDGLHSGFTGMFETDLARGDACYRPLEPQFPGSRKHTTVIYRVLDQGTGVLEISAPENTMFGWSFYRVVCYLGWGTGSANGW